MISETAEAIVPDSAHPDLKRGYSRWAEFSVRSGLPPLDAMLADPSIAHHPGLAVVEVERFPDRPPRFRYVKGGALLVAAFDRGVEGYALDEVVARQKLPMIERTYHGVVEGRRGHYWLRTVTNRVGEVRSFERLLLPLSEDGVTVDRLLALFVWLEEAAGAEPELT